jgi:hypothetical protein
LSFGDDKEATLENMNTPIPTSESQQQQPQQPQQPPQPPQPPQQQQQHSQQQEQHSQPKIKTESEGNEFMMIKNEDSENNSSLPFINERIEFRPPPLTQKKNSNKLKLNIQPKLKSSSNESTTNHIQPSTSPQLQQIHHSQPQSQLQLQSQSQSPPPQPQEQSEEQNQTDTFRLVDYGSDNE